MPIQVLLEARVCVYVQQMLSKGICIGYYPCSKAVQLIQPEPEGCIIDSRGEGLET